MDLCLFPIIELLSEVGILLKVVIKLPRDLFLIEDVEIFTMLTFALLLSLELEFLSSLTF
jgi:hypothetical protein